MDENKENSYSKILTPDNIDFEMSSSKIKESINNPLEAFHIANETLKNELVKVRSELAALKQNIKNTECDKFKSFDQHVLQNDKLCNHYIGFPTNIILQAVFEYWTLVEVMKILFSTIVRKQKKMKHEVGNECSQQFNHFY